jgi:hypothetical protein
VLQNVLYLVQEKKHHQVGYEEEIGASLFLPGKSKNYEDI